MKRVLTALAAVMLLCLTVAMAGCAASKAEISQATNNCDIMVEVRTLGKDSVSWFAGNTMYLNANLAKREEIFPMFISTRSTANIDVQRGIDLVKTPEELFAFFGRGNGPVKNFGVVFSDRVEIEAGVDEGKTVEKLKKVFRGVEGVSLMLFHEKDGNIKDMKRIF